MILAAASNGKTLWFVTRGLGVGALLLLTASIALGVLTTAGWRSPRWPRFASAGLHRNLTLLAICVVVLHVVTTILDGYTTIRFQDAVIPFISSYRPVWLGLGAISFDLLLALVATSLLRARIGYRAWRWVHWLAYASWPIAIVHALGTGSDARLGWMRVVGVLSVTVVALAVFARFSLQADIPRAVRLAGALAAIVAPALIVTWYESGPAQRGWAKRAGTPASLLGAPRTVALTAGSVASPALPTSAFSASVKGTIREANTGSGLLDVTIRGRLHGGPGGAVRIVLRGEPLQGGVSMTASGVSYVPAGTNTVYYGSVSSLEGTQVTASVATSSGARLILNFVLNIDTASKLVDGTVDGTPA